MESGEFARWLDRYGAAWKQGDADAVQELFTADATYHEVPFDEPMVGVDAIRRYWTEGAGQSQRDVDFGHDVLSFDDEVGIARWKASFVRVPSGSEVHLDGILVADFDSSQRCTRFREWWHREES